MTDLMGVVFALLLILALIWDNRDHPGAWHDKEDRHH